MSVSSQVSLHSPRNDWAHHDVPARLQHWGHLVTEWSCWRTKCSRTTWSLPQVPRGIQSVCAWVIDTHTLETNHDVILKHGSAYVSASPCYDCVSRGWRSQPWTGRSRTCNSRAPRPDPRVVDYSVPLKWTALNLGLRKCYELKVRPIEHLF